ncbi:hypothetical protein CCP4SC76_1390010 [Gammaproteobacteria bacterium]
MRKTLAGMPIMTRRKLPIGVQTFAKIISGGYYYVDKTHLILRLAQSSGYFFLSRPRRFGKSLLLDTRHTRTASLINRIRNRLP